VKPWVVLRKSYKSYMGDALSEETLSITTGSPQTLYLDEKDQRLLRGKAVVLLDDVVTTGSTFGGMRALIEKVDALGHLPVFTGRTGES
jgi:adenine phosphoribosyltransferase